MRDEPSFGRIHAQTGAVSRRIGVTGLTGRALATGTGAHGPPLVPQRESAGTGLSLASPACDCHVHVFDPGRFAYVAARSYTPAEASVDALVAFEAGLGMERVVLVQPSVYGRDNRCLVDALTQLGPLHARGVAVIDVNKVTPQQMDALHTLGVRSIRLNLEVHGECNAEHARRMLQDALTVVADRQWSIQIYADLLLVQALSDVIAAARSPIVLDHFAGLKAGRGLAQPGFSSLLQLLRIGHVYVKLSAPYRASSLPDHADLPAFVCALVAAGPDNLVWASDWPYTASAAGRSGDLSQVERFRCIDSAQVLAQLASWVGDPVIWQQILVHNPACLYHFS